MSNLRREFLRAVALGVAVGSCRALYAQSGGNGTTAGNFRYIYADAAARREFKNFLVTDAG